MAVKVDLDREIRSLPDRKRQVILWRSCEQWTVREVAAKMGVKYCRIQQISTMGYTESPSSWSICDKDTRNPPPQPDGLRYPTLRQLARRLVRFCTSGNLDAEDLEQEARAELYQQREQIVSRPDPIAPAYTTARRAMWTAVQRENRVTRLTHAG